MSIATTLPIGTEINPGQYRLSEIQIINWGTFHGRHAMYVDRAGTLLTGHPGVGKSTLFDGIQHIFYAAPRLNESAHEASNRKDRRTTFSYMRGRKIKTADGIVYQRPSATWSATALVFEDGLGRHVTIAALFDLPANGLEGQVGKHYVIHDRPLDTEALENHGSRRFSPSSLHTALPGSEAFDVHKTFAERFRRKLGIDNDKAFSLLRTLQNGKGLDKGVNRFFRYEVLDKPATLAAAKAAVDDFSHLRGIYRQLEDARGQRDALAPVPELHRKLREFRESHTRTVELKNVQLPLLRRQFQAELLAAKAVALREGHAQTRAEIDAAACAKDALVDSVAALDEQHASHGGRAIEGLEKDIRTATRELEERLRLESSVRDDLEKAGLDVDWTPAGLETARQGAAAGVELQQSETESARNLEYEAVAASINAKAEEKKLRAEISSYQRRDSNIDGRSAATRRAICAETGLDPSEVPFAGELVDIGGEHSAWRPAAEKVLRSLATTLLVRGQDIKAVTSAINALEGHGRLRWINMAAAVRAAEAGEDHLATKLEFQNSAAGNWLRAKVTRDFGFRCVDSDAELHEHDRALSLAGTLKANAATFERDTRPVNPADYLLGFNNVDKIAQLEARADDLAAACKSAAALADQRSKAKDQLTGRLAALKRVANDRRPFEQLDSAGLAAQLGKLRQTLQAAIDSSTTLASIRAELGEAKAELEAAVGRLAVLNNNLSVLEGELRTVEASAESTKAQAGAEPPSAWAVEEFAPYVADGGPATLEELEQPFSRAALDLGERAAAVKERIFRSDAALGETFKAFAREFGPSMSASYGTGADAAEQYEELYERIISDGLPQRQEEFREYFNNRSYERFSDLLQLLEEERRAIGERILPLNQILAEVPFEKGSRLRLEVATSIPDEARAFRAELKEALGNAYTKATEEKMATSYQQLERLVDALSDSSMQSWADTVLDVRQHVTISCNEHRPNGEVELGLEPGTLSGGEGQRFTSFIMGAALAYQLGIDTQGYSTYGTVMIDEAFIQANSEYAGAGINALQEFGFQLLLAAPEDKVDLSRHLGSVTDIIKHPQANISGFVSSGRSPATATDIILR
ncbi:chromosome segregation protein SMC [Arthrobacter livingstonensis]|uniref:Chromosome segregation protein SMC n=1 Tax=Arthrobacter livingstonensis TaxID=670078 RepID=A0A2V5L077_9MICC|nr:ATP-binding protein [Arthrobacter livingstonensis]PYI64358.1 chromosome segregation protein SMC [Arthrobacter livingstonensis]